MNSDSYIKTLVRKYLDGTCTKEELEELFQLLPEIAEGKIEDVAEKLWLDIGEERAIPEEKAEVLFDKIIQKEVNYHPFKHWYKIAAAVTGLIIVSAVVYNYFFYNSYTVYKTAFGETKTIVLPDHSTVTLNSNSWLKFKSGWKQSDEREVWLNGEAFFSVIHTKQHEKFKVITPSQFNVEVLGTQFNLLCRKGRSRVVLNEGKVKLNIKEISNLRNNCQDTLVMKPGELVEFKNATCELIKRKVNPVNYSSWKNKLWVLEETTLEEVAEMIRENYGVDVQFTDPNLKKEKITGTIPTVKLESVLRILEDALKLKIRKNKDYVMIST